MSGMGVHGQHCQKQRFLEKEKSRSWMCQGVAAQEGGGPRAQEEVRWVADRSFNK